MILCISGNRINIYAQFECKSKVLFQISRQFMHNLKAKSFTVSPLLNKVNEFICLFNFILSYLKFLRVNGSYLNLGHYVLVKE